MSAELSTELVRASDFNGGLHALAQNEYPGRVLIMGLGEEGDTYMQAYAIMGRRAGSRNRIFVHEGDSVRTVAPGKTAQEMAATAMSELIYYRAIRTDNAGLHVVSNGAQTDPVFEAMLLQGKSLGEAVRDAPTVEGINLSAHEPDEPNYTPRITGVIDLTPQAVTPFGLAVAYRDTDSPYGNDTSYRVRTAQLEDFVPGEGYGVQTYNGNGDPLPAFDQEPFAFPMGVDAAETADRLWETLDRDNRVAVVVRAIDRATGQVLGGTPIINAINAAA